MLWLTQFQMYNAHLSEKDLLAHLEDSSELKKSFPNFESRPEQKGMLKDIIQAFNQDKIALIEAGTGCGKSMAYLIPALTYARDLGEQVVISTHTINLQEQLLEKDIPLISKALEISLKVVLVKGMHNYLCLRKFHETFQTRLVLSEDDIKCLDSIHDQLNHFKEGSKSELKVLPSYSTWEEINAESDTCTGPKCPYYNDCYFTKARQQIENAQILVVNHHLLFADLAMKSDKNVTSSLLPPYSRLIIDEAHHIEEVATEYFAKKVNRLFLLKTIGRLLNENAGGKIGQLKEKVSRHFGHNPHPDSKSLLSRLELDIPGKKKTLLEALTGMYQSVLELLENGQFQEETKLRLQEHHQNHPLFKDGIHPKALSFADELKRVEQMILSLNKDIEALKDEKLNEQTGQLRHDMKALAGRLSDAADTLKHMMTLQIPENRVRWIDHSQKGMRANTTLTDASLDLSELFTQNLFSRFKTIVLSSATLTANQKFDYLEERFGLKSEEMSPRVQKSLYPSPFNYASQAALGLPDDMPDPTDPNYNNAASDAILKLLEASKGGAFVLFTSYRSLQATYQQLKDPLEKRGLRPLKQGEMSRKDLIKAFKETRYGVLFGTDSFWEGVDVAGEALRLVIIQKLPFKVPSEPLIQARLEKLKEEGKEPFRSYSLPQAILKLKQGFGRLIRKKSDHGAIVILDPRIKTKNYGKSFLKSLPVCHEVLGSLDEVVKGLKQFYASKNRPRST